MVFLRDTLVLTHSLSRFFFSLSLARLRVRVRVFAFLCFLFEVSRFEVSRFRGLGCFFFFYPLLWTFPLPLSLWAFEPFMFPDRFGSGRFGGNSCRNAEASNMMMSMRRAAGEEVRKKIK